MRPGRQRGEAGFTLLELLIATVILVFGVVTVALMVSYGIRLQGASRDGTLATALAKAQIERLRVLPPSAPQRRVGGSLTADEPDHFDQTGKFRRRWVVAAGPAGTQDLTLLAWAPADARVPPARFRVLIR